MHSNLFISFANAQLKENPEYLDSFLDEIIAYNQKVFFQIANYSEEELLELYDINENGVGVIRPDPEINSLFQKMSDYAESKHIGNYLTLTAWAHNLFPVHKNRKHGNIRDFYFQGKIT